MTSFNNMGINQIIETIKNNRKTKPVFASNLNREKQVKISIMHKYKEEAIKPMDKKYKAL